MTTRLDEDPLLASLDVFSAIPEWLAAAMDGAHVADSLRRNAPELVDEGLSVVGCTPERLRAKGDEWLARYTVRLAAPDEPPRDVVLVGNLRPPDRQHELQPGTAAGDPRTGEPGWRCVLPDLGLELLAVESDDALPALPQLVDPAAAAQLLRGVLVDAGYRGVEITDCQPVVVRYKPGSRCTVLVRLAYADPATEPAPPTPIVLKTHQGDKGRTAWEAMSALWERPAAHDGSVTLAEPLAYLPEERILVQGPVPEDQTLKDLAREAVSSQTPVLLQRLRDELAATGRALAALHRSGASYGRTATFDEELAEVREVVDRLSRSVPELASGALPVLDHLAAAAREEAPETPVPAHHDFRPAQVLLHDGGIGFIDFDGACMAEPALDVGRFCAKLRDIGIHAFAAAGGQLSGEPLRAHLELMDEMCDDFIRAYEEHAPLSRRRVQLWEAVDLLTSMLHAWTKVRLARLEPRMVILRRQLGASASDRNGSERMTGIEPAF